MAATQVKLLPTDLPTQIGQNVVLVNNTTGAEIRGTVGSYDSTHAKVQVAIGNSHQWFPTNLAGYYIYKVNVF